MRRNVAECRSRGGRVESHAIRVHGKRSLVLIGALVLLALAAKPEAAPSLAAPPFTAVEVPPKMAQFYSEHFAQELTLRGLHVLTAADINQLLGVEREKQLLGCDDTQCIAELADALGADGLISGTIAKIGSAYQLDIRVIAADGSRVLGAYSQRANDESEILPAIAAAADAIAPRIFSALGRAPIAQLTQVRDSGSSRTPAFVAYGIAGALLIGAGAMAIATKSNYDQAVDDYRRSPFTQSASGQKLGWMGPLTDALWISALVAAGVGTYFFFFASPDGGAQLALGATF